MIAAASENVDSKTDRLSLADLRAELDKVPHSASVYAGQANVRTDLKQVQRLPLKEALVQIFDNAKGMATEAVAFFKEQANAKTEDAK